jgi:hypothetical protein
VEKWREKESKLRKVKGRRTKIAKKDLVEVNHSDGSYRDKFDESLDTLSAVESQLWVSF